MARSDQTTSFYNIRHTRVGLQAADARGLDRCWAAGSQRGAIISAYIHCCFLFRVKKKYAGLFRSSDSKSSPRGDESNLPNKSKHREDSPGA